MRRDLLRSASFKLNLPISPNACIPPTRTPAHPHTRTPAHPHARTHARTHVHTHTHTHYIRARECASQGARTWRGAAR